jgi:hypothetical protein
MEWGCYAWARGVEESEFYLFLVVFPARCISSVSPRFYFRKHTFCFLPLVTILESLCAAFSTSMEILRKASSKRQRVKRSFFIGFH